MEHLRETLWVLLLIDEQITGDHHKNITVWRGWLRIQSGDTVGHLLERQGNKLLDDILGTLDLGGLKGQHGLLSVEVAQLGSVRIELVVVEFCELLGQGGKIDGHDT